ncbi:MAG: anti-phage protein KwaB [Eubacteriales bacterium]
MDFQELKTHVEKATQADNSLELFLLMKKEQKGERTYYVASANIDDDCMEDIFSLYSDFLKNAVVDTDENRIIPLSSADERANVIYEYDLETVPPELASALESELDNVEMLQLNDDTLTNLVGFIAKIGDDQQNIRIFKRHYAINLIKSKQGYLARKENQLESFEGELLRINGTVDFIRVKDCIFILSLKELEKFGKFHDIIKREARKGIRAINRIELLESSEPLEDELDNTSFARKLTRIKDSIVLRQSTQTIIAFARSKYPNIQFNEDETKLRIATKKSKNELIKLLSDARLKSELTNEEYDALAKDRVEE